MQFTIIARDDTAEGTLDRRLANRAAHMERIHELKAEGVIIDGGAMLDDAGRMIGFAIHHHHDSTWVMTPDGYLEDLYLDPEARGKGIGRALIDDLIAICRANGWSRLYWHTNRDNAQARKLYESYVEDQGYMRYRIDLR